MRYSALFFKKTQNTRKKEKNKENAHTREVPSYFLRARKNRRPLKTKSDHAAQGRPKRAPTLAQALQQAPRGRIRYPRRSLRVLQGFALAYGSPNNIK